MTGDTRRYSSGAGAGVGLPVPDTTTLFPRAPWKVVDVDRGGQRKNWLTKYTGHCMQDLVITT